MARRWPRRSARKAPAPNAGAPSPEDLADAAAAREARASIEAGEPLIPWGQVRAEAGMSSSVRITGSGSPAVPSCAFHAAPAVSCPVSWTDPRDQADIALATARESWAPPPLAGIGADVMLAVAAVPGKILEEWRHAAMGAWIAWPHAVDAIHAEEMTAAQLRAILAARDSHG